ncbi:hypothetical protein PMI16_02457 [Herbaspirillum sp. CF444]|uniref:hypothetical protein n=1 Tax=Herbaspirillum sp. CF444 TaxID=1144319 RepID=UPI0002724012|nr:hypothetical protein [Herbaspirillum sp. CF444]EJL88280.1 hypothetical protein PMI16_02457 [Herbaspirillum sp. CF444]
MQKIVSLSVALGILISAALPAQARNETFMLPIDAALKATTLATKPDGSVKFYFGKQATPAVEELIHTDVISKKVRFSGTADVEACNEALVSSLTELQERTRKMGGNAVINIVSYYKKTEMSSETRFECHAGTSSVVFFLKADIAKVADK